MPDTNTPEYCRTAARYERHQSLIAWAAVPLIAGMLLMLMARELMIAAVLAVIITIITALYYRIENVARKTAQRHHQSPGAAHSSRKTTSATAAQCVFTKS